MHSTEKTRRYLKRLLVTMFGVVSLFALVGCRSAATGSYLKRKVGPVAKKVTAEALDAVKNGAQVVTNETAQKGLDLGNHYLNEGYNYWEREKTNRSSKPIYPQASRTSPNNQWFKNFCLQPQNSMRFKACRNEQFKLVPPPISEKERLVQLAVTRSGIFGKP